MVEIVKSQKIRIYPNKHNQEVFEKYYDYQRSVWNRAIDERNRQYLIYKEQKDSGNFTQKELNKLFYPSHINLRKMKKEDWELKFHNRIRNVQFERLCKTWDNYFNPNMPNHKKPKYKKKKDVETLKKVGFKDVRFKDRKMFLPNARKSTNETKFSAIRMSEKIRFDGKQIEDVVKDAMNNFNEADKLGSPDQNSEQSSGLPSLSDVVNALDNKETTQEAVQEEPVKQESLSELLNQKEEIQNQINEVNDKIADSSQESGQVTNESNSQDEGFTMGTLSTQGDHLQSNRDSEYAFDRGFAEWADNTLNATFDGKLMAMPSISPGADAIPILFVRGDWMDELGLDEPKTVEDITNIVKAFKEKYGDSNSLVMSQNIVSENGNNTYGMDALFAF